MTTLTWTPELVLQQPQMDATHEEFVALLAAAGQAASGPTDALLAHWDTVVAHTVEHFAMEDRWMAATGFAPENCHAFQHQAVLQVMQECSRRAREEADFEPLRIAITELGVWFPQHAQMMDAALVQHMASVGFDPATGQITPPAGTETGAAAAAPLSSCGSSGCGD